MNNYIDYDYYTNVYSGKLIPQESFEKFATRASGEVRLRIHNRPIAEFEDEVKSSTCSVAEILYKQSKIKEKIDNIINGVEVQITSEKVGDYSRNMSNVSFEELKVMSSNDMVNNEINQELETNLLYTGLLYAGIDYVR